MPLHDKSGATASELTQLHTTRKCCRGQLARSGWLHWLVGWLTALAMARFVVTLLLLLPVLFESVFSISFFLPVNSRKCLREEIHKDVLVTGEYEVSEQPNTKTNLKVSTAAANANAR